MSRWLLAWEMGHGLGHLAGLMALAQQALLHGIEPVIASCKPLPSSVLLPAGARFLLAPTLPSLSAPMAGTSSMTELLFEQGFGHAEALVSGVQRWRDLIEIVAPDALVADHAPTALLTARALGVAAVQLGTGFAIPPSRGTGALPSFRTWETPNAQRMAQAESTISVALQQVAARTGLPLATSVAALYDTPWVIRSVPMLDHYATALRGQSSHPARYCGPLELATAAASATPDWPGTTGTEHARVLVYLKAAHPLTLPLLNALALHRGRATISALAYVEGAEGVGNPHANIHIQNTPLPFKTLLASAHCVIHQGGIGASSQALLAGVSQLVLPDMAEAFITARTLVAEGVAELLRPEASRDAVQQCLSSLLDSGRYRHRAGELAASNATFSGDNSALLWRLINDALAPT